MTPPNKLEQAAIKCGRAIAVPTIRSMFSMSRGEASQVLAEAFKAGANWAVQNDERVPELIKTLEFIENEYSHYIGAVERNLEVQHPFHNVFCIVGDAAKEALAKWKGGEE